MGAQAEPWQKAEIAGPKKALLITKPQVVAALITRAKRPLLVIGHHAAEEYNDQVRMLDYALRLSRAAAIPMVTTGHLTIELIKRGVRPAGSMLAMEIGSRLVDPEWRGLDGKGQYDLALFMGLPYYMEFVILSGLKHFSTNLKTVSLDRFYNPHASWSIPNLSVEAWRDTFEALLSVLKGE